MLTGEGNCAFEPQKAAGLNHRDEHVAGGGIGNDPPDPRDGEIALGARAAARLVIDDPIANKLGGPAEILAGELIALCRNVMVAGIFPIQEYASGH